MVRNLGEARLQKVLSILDRASSGMGGNVRGSAHLPRPHLPRPRQPRPEKPRENPEKRDDSESDAA
jgi:hypothetical protein